MTVTTTSVVCGVAETRLAQTIFFKYIFFSFVCRFDGKGANTNGKFGRRNNRFIKSPQTKGPKADKEYYI